jgi:hypothetical protein
MEKVICFVLFTTFFMPTVSLVWLATGDRPATAVFAYMALHFALFASLQYSGMCFQQQTHTVPEK